MQVPTIVTPIADSFVGGTVIDASGKPVAGAMVSVDGVQDSSTTTDQNGQFLLHGAPRDKCTVTIRTPNAASIGTNLVSGRNDNVIYLQKLNTNR